MRYPGETIIWIRKLCMDFLPKLHLPMKENEEDIEDMGVESARDGEDTLSAEICED